MGGRRAGIEGPPESATPNPLAAAATGGSQRAGGGPWTESDECAHGAAGSSPLHKKRLLLRRSQELQEPF